MSDDQSEDSQSKPMTFQTAKVSEIDFGYHHANETFIVYPGRCHMKSNFSLTLKKNVFFFHPFLGLEDTTSLNYSPDGSFVDHKQSVTLVVHAGGYQVPILCWLLLIVLLLSIFTSIVIICCFCFKTKRVRRRKEDTRVSSHINGFSQANVVSPIEMLPKYVASPAQSYSTQKLYQWCQQKEMQQYKSLWAVNPTSGECPFY